MNAIFLCQKLKIIGYVEKGEKQVAICQHLRLPKNTISAIWRSRKNSKCHLDSVKINIDCKCFCSSVYQDILVY